MATITMDASEYEALKENIKLLKEAKQREVELSDEIKELQQEKIEALKNAQHNVTITKKSVSTELIVKRRSDEDILRYLRNYFNNESYSNFLRNRTFSHSSELDMILNMCFEKRENRNVVEDETITTKGFEEVKEEIKRDYLEKLSEQTRAELEDFKKMQPEYSDTLRKNKRLEEENYRLLGDIQNCGEKLFQIEKTLSDLKHNVIKVLSSKWNIFNYSNNLQKLKQILCIP